MQGRHFPHFEFRLLLMLLISKMTLKGTTLQNFKRSNLRGLPAFPPLCMKPGYYKRASTFQYKYIHVQLCNYNSSPQLGDQTHCQSHEHGQGTSPEVSSEVVGTQQ